MLTYIFYYWDFQVKKCLLISVGFQKILRYTFDRAHIRDDFIQEVISTYKRNEGLSPLFTFIIW